LRIEEVRSHVVDQSLSFLLVQDLAEKDARLSEVVIVAGVVPGNIAADLLVSKYLNYKML
jgi:hypothetical protein